MMFWKKKYCFNFNLMVLAKADDGAEYMKQEPFKYNVKLTYKPNAGEIFYFNKDPTCYKVDNVYHNIVDGKQIIWILLIKLKGTR